MFLQHNNIVSSDPVTLKYMGRSKAQSEANGHSPGKHCNAAAEHHRAALRVSLSTPTDCVAYMDVGEGREQEAVSFAPIDKGVAIPCKVRLGNCSCIALLPSIHGHITVNVDKLTEPAIITLKEHLI